jgi:inorganic pyrophosphatase
MNYKINIVFYVVDVIDHLFEVNKKTKLIYISKFIYIQIIIIIITITNYYIIIKTYHNIIIYNII